MDPQVLAATVARCNELVEKGADEDFDKPKLRYKIAEGPFYAAWATFAVYDSYAGLRPGPRLEGRGDQEPLVRRRIRGRVLPARARALSDAGLHYRPQDC